MEGGLDVCLQSFSKIHIDVLIMRGLGEEAFYFSRFYRSTEV